MKQILSILLIMGCGMFVNAQTVPMEELKLSPDQEIQVQKIQKAAETEIKTLLPLMKSNPKEFHAKRKAINASSDKSILALLEEPQKKTYKKITEARELMFSKQFQAVKKGGSK